MPIFIATTVWLRAISIHNEHGLLQRIADGDPQAYTEIYQSYFPLMLHCATRMLKVRQAAEDLCNEIFLSLWQNRHSLSHIESLEAYLLAAVRNRSINALKKFARSHEMLQQVKDAFPSHSIDTEASLLSKEYVQFVKREVEELPSRAREVFNLCREEGYSYEEVSARLGISRNAVKWHMVVSMKKLKASAEKALGISFFLLLLLSAIRF